MASTSKCQYCDSTISSSDKQCPSCGAPNPNYVAETTRSITKPKTIEELKTYCAERGMPLLRMRFFIDEDYKQPRAFGIYRDGDRFVVYKNKSDGSRAIRYQGPDEAYAVNELYMKLLTECHNRGIYPDGKPEGIDRSGGNGANKKQSKRWVFILAGVLLYVFFFVFMLAHSCRLHRHDGYYDFNDGKIWYLHGNDWYYSNEGSTGSNSWHGSSFSPIEGDYEQYYQGKDYDSDWGVTDFHSSDAYEDNYGSDSSSSSSDYDSWDSSDTDWDSDW